MTIASKITVSINTQPPRTKNAKSVYCITDGTFFASVLDAAIQQHASTSEISKNCNDKVKSVKGKQYCFVHDMPMRIEDIANAMREAKATQTKTIAKLQKQNEILRSLLIEEQQRITNIINNLGF